MAKNHDYWVTRFKALEDEQYQKSAAYYKDVQEQYRRAINDIQLDMNTWYQRLADNNGISYASARKFLKSSELEEFKWTVEQYIKAGMDNGVNGRWIKQLENASAKYHISRLDAMKLQLQQHAELLSTEFNNGITDFLHKSYTDQYYKSAFEIAKGTGIGHNLSAIDIQRADVIIKRPWAQDGKNFSDRIWTNKEKLVQNLHTELTQCVIRGAPINTAIDNLSKTMNVSRAQAGRLIMTESAAISAAAQKDCFSKIGVEKYEILAALDSSTCDICQDLDGKVFEIKEYEVGLTAHPFHPNCRCTEIPYFDDEFSAQEERVARNPETGKTYYVPADMKYPEWKEQFVIEKEKSKRKNNVNSVNWEYVNSAEFREKFDFISDDDKLNQTVYNKVKDILRHRNNTDYEDMYLINGNKVVGAQTHSQLPLGVTYNEELRKAIKNTSEGILISIHNHPRSTPPSGGDFVSNARNRYKLGIIACHNGDIYLYKTGKIPFTSGLFDRKVIEYQQGPFYLNEIAAYNKVLEEFEREYGIWWKKL